MINNPYKYTGPLDPFTDKAVCVPRDKDVNTVIRLIKSGKYLAILGPRQIGKTTFLRQIQKNFPENAYYIFFDFSVAPKSEEKFYQWVAKIIINEIPTKTIPEITEVDSPYKFLDFLVSFKPKKDDRKIIFFFDEIELIPDSFLRVLRKVYIIRLDQKELQKYSVVIAGSVDLIKATMVKTSPFNIAHEIYLKDFSDEESEMLIDEPFAKLKIAFKKKAKDKLISQVAGHPQMFQQVCYILFDMASKEKRNINEKDVDKALEALMKNSTALDTLKNDFRINDHLADVIRSILEEEKNLYHTYKEFSLIGAGPIIDEDGYCAIRNKVFEKFLNELIETVPEPKEKLLERLPKAFICFSSKDVKWWESFSKYSNTNYHEILLDWEKMKGKSKKELRKEIEEKIDSSDISIFLVSDASVTPDFLLQKGLFELIKQKMKEGKKIFPVIVPTSSWENIQKFAELMSKDY